MADKWVPFAGLTEKQNKALRARFLAQGRTGVQNMLDAWRAKGLITGTGANISTTTGSAPISETKPNIATRTGPGKTPDSTTPPGTSGEPGEKTEDKIEGKTPEQIAKETSDILANAKNYGDQMVKDYINDEMFKQIEAATTPEMKAYLEDLRVSAEGAGKLTGLEQESLAAMRSGMMGYAAPEIQAMREAAAGQIAKDRQAQEYLARRQLASSGVRGAASSAYFRNLAEQEQTAKGNLERDLVIQNAQEIQDRRKDFSALVRGTEDARFGRQQSAQAMYGGALTGEEAARTGREIFNTGQATNKGLASAGLALQGQGVYTGMYGGQQAQDYAAQSLAAYNKWSTDYLNTMKELEKMREESMAKFYKNYNKS